MEKDHFKDRPIQSTRWADINIGDTVLICEKHMQKTASNIDDLTEGVVVRKLTNSDHPRGIKVKIDISFGNNVLIVGRVVYVKKNDRWLTKKDSF